MGLSQGGGDSGSSSFLQQGRARTASLGPVSVPEDGSQREVHGSKLLVAKQRLLSYLPSITYGPEPRVRHAHAPAVFSCVANSNPSSLSTSDGERKTPRTYLSPEHCQGSWHYLQGVSCSLPRSRESGFSGHFNVTSLVAHPFNPSTGGRGKLAWSTQ